VLSEYFPRGGWSNPAQAGADGNEIIRILFPPTTADLPESAMLQILIITLRQDRSFDQAPSPRASLNGPRSFSPRCTGERPSLPSPASSPFLLRQADNKPLWEGFLAAAAAVIPPR
jgi:hypothetical protein